MAALALAPWRAFRSERTRCRSVEQAQGGTLLLDEIGDLPLELQPKLLRALEAKEIHRIGDPAPRRVDVRVIAATHRDLRITPAERFGLDLYQRLSRIELIVPPLRERRMDIGFLARAFLDAVARELGRPLQLTDDAVALLEGLEWKGNVRQLKNVIERAGWMVDGNVISRRELAPWLPIARPAPPVASADEGVWDQPLKDASERWLEDFQRRYCERLLAQCGGDLDQVCARAGYTRKGLRELMKRLGLVASGVDVE